MGSVKSVAVVRQRSEAVDLYKEAEKILATQPDALPIRFPVS